MRDGLGRQVRLPVPSEIHRVVSLAPSSTEILFALGLGPAVVGVDRYSDWPAAAQAIERVGADVDPSLERIVHLRPDVVFTSTSANTQRTAETLERFKVPVYVSQSLSLDGIYSDILAIGEVVGRAADAARLIEQMKARMKKVTDASAGAPKVKALIAVWTQPLMVAGRSSHVGDLLRAAGGENIAEDSVDPFPTYSLERIVARAPDVVVVGTHSDQAPPMELIDRIGGAIERDRRRRFRVVTVDGNLLFRPGPRVVEGVEALGRLLHAPPVSP